MFLIFLGCYLKAQQELQYTMYSMDNPSVSGLFNKHCAAISVSDYWKAYSKNIYTIKGFYDVKMNCLHGGLGVNYAKEQLGIEENMIININYSFYLDLYSQNYIQQYN